MLRATVAASLTFTFLLGACGSGEPAPAGDAQAAGEARAAEQDDHRHDRRPLPAFEGRTLDGPKLAVASLLGKRLVLFFFNPEVEAAQAAARATAEIAALRGEHNFAVLGIATASDAETARAFVAAHGLDVPVIDDSSARIVRRLGLRQPVVFVGVDPEGYVSFAFSGQAEGSQAQQLVETQLRKNLRLPLEEHALDTALGARPEAPRFTAERLDGDEPFVLAEALGRPLVLIFFLHTCPHCHEALGTLREQLAAMPEEKRPRLVGLSVDHRPHAVRSSLETEGLDFFPVIFDPDGSIRRQYGVMAGVPDTFLIDAEGRIAARVPGWRDERDPPLMRMRLAKLAGLPVPMLLDPEGYSGTEACAVCHESEHATWQFTEHAHAFDTLVKHGAAGNAECVGCHVVGFEKPGGYSLAEAQPHFEDVGCESCHGRGGPHLSPDFVVDHQYEKACLTCHDPKHSLGFEYASFLPKVSHAANRHLLALSPEEKRERLQALGQPRDSLLPTAADYVGSEACKSCHAAEYATWSASGHALANVSLVDEGKAEDTDCLRCHTTAYGQPGGFPEGGALAEHPDLGRVGCESCHGPGGDHVEDGARGSIVSLGDKCDSCVILQICGSCHDDANDPGFEFEVQEKIDQQRHGTIEAGTGKPKSAFQPDAASVELGQLEQAFRLLDDRG